MNAGFAGLAGIAFLSHTFYVHLIFGAVQEIRYEAFGKENHQYG
tara:strand:- start:361 stop:492 length:132 start_codon:yes stop_codon:yes gene_type:complete